VICEHLELAFAGEIRRLLINIQPRVMKSTLVSVLRADVAVDDEPRDAVPDRLARPRPRAPRRREEPRPDHVRLVPVELGRRVPARLRPEREEPLLEQPHRLPDRHSVGSGVTGEGGDVLILDDPNHADDAFSQAPETGRRTGGAAPGRPG
jgi:hypothetical protein